MVPGEIPGLDQEQRILRSGRHETKPVSSSWCGSAWCQGRSLVGSYGDGSTKQSSRTLLTGGVLSEAIGLAARLERAPLLLSRLSPGEGISAEVVAVGVGSQGFDRGGEHRGHRAAGSGLRVCGSRGYVRRHGVDRVDSAGARLSDARVAFADAWEQLQSKDLAFGVFAGVIVKGWIMYTFAFAVTVFGRHKDLAGAFSMVGTGEWVIAMALFFFFLSDPQPRHSKRRYTERTRISGRRVSAETPQVDISD